MSDKCLGFDSKVRYCGKVWQYFFGLAEPSSSYDKFSRELFGGLVCGLWDGEVLRLLDFISFRRTAEVSDYEFILGGVRPRLYTDARYVRYADRYSPYYVDRRKLDEYSDIVLQKVHDGCLQFEKGGVVYKKMGLFLSNPGSRKNEFIASLGVLLYGIESE